MVVGFKGGGDAERDSDGKDDGKSDAVWSERDLWSRSSILLAEVSSPSPSDEGPDAIDDARRWPYCAMLVSESTT